jgi:hypothetical protein
VAGKQKQPDDAPLSSYLKWSALMVAAVVVVGVIAARVIHELGLD